MFKTTNGGTNWPSFGFYNATSNNDNINLSDIIFDPLDNANILVSGNQLWRWNNNTSQWSDITGSLSNQPGGGIELSISGNNIYALYYSSGAKIDISIDGGVTWDLHTTTNEVGPHFIVSPANANYMYIGKPGNVIYKSTNGGASFSYISLYNGIYNGTSTHCDIRGLQLVSGSIDGLNDIIFAGTDGGVLYSTSAIAPNGTTVNWKNANGTGLAVGTFFGASNSEKIPGRIIVGAQDNGLATYDNSIWINRLVGDAYHSVIDKGSPAIVISEKISWGSPELDDGIYFLRSIDGGQSWSNLLQPAWGNQNSSNNVGFSPHIWNVKASPLSINQNNIVFLGFHDLFKFNSSNNTWTPLSDFTAKGVGMGSGCSAFEIAPSNPEIIYFAFEGQTWDENNLIKMKLWKTTNGGVLWSDITNNLPVNYAGISCLVIDPENSDRIWVAFNGIWPDGNLTPPLNGFNRVYYSSDGGSTWSDYSIGLPSLPINAIVYEKGFNDGLYIGTDAGFFFTNRALYNSDDIFNNQNSGWVCFSDGFPLVVATDLKINYATNKIRAATFGRGVWESSLACPINADLNFTTSNSSNISSSFQEVSNNISVTADAGDINLTDFVARAGNEIVISAIANHSVIIGHNSHLFIHPCDEPGNSFRKSNGNDGEQDDGKTFVENSKNIIKINFDVYPNPTQGVFTLKLSEEVLNIETSIFIADLLGEIIWQLKNNFEDEITINISSYPKGIYFVKITANNGMSTTKKIILI